VKVASAAESVGLYPSRVRVITRVYKSRNRLDSTSEVIYSVRRDSAGENHLEIVKVTEDGKDRTIEARKEEKKAERERKAKSQKGKKDDKSLSVSLNFRPFSPTSQDKISIFRTGTKMLKGRSAVIFDFTVKSSSADGVVKGKAWIDAVTGVPLKVVSSPDPLPKHVKSMRTTVIFRLNHDGRWVSDHSLIEARGSFLLISRDVVTRVTFSKYREKAPTTLPPNKTENQKKS